MPCPFVAEVASEQAERTFKGQRALVVAGEGWHEGVKGIVASRLTNRYGVPSILFTIEGEEAHGSGRSVGDVNLFEAVSSCQDILTRFGGHHAAVGVTLPASTDPRRQHPVGADFSCLCSLFAGVGNRASADG